MQTNAGTYQVALQINGGTVYTAPLNGNGSFQFSNLPMFNGGETISLSVQGLSNRTGAVLVTSAGYTQTVPYLAPAISVVQKIERLNAQGNWETTPSIVTGQTARYTLTTTLTNQPATWGQQMLKVYVPNGLIQVSPVTLIRTSNAGVQTPVLGTQLLTYSTLNMQYCYYQNPLAVNNFTQANTSYTLQYTGVVAQNMTGQTLPFSSIVGGADGGGTAIPLKNNASSIQVADGTLRFVQSPTQISFKSIPVPTKTTTYSPSIVNTSLIVADGRVTKSQWPPSSPVATAALSTGMGTWTLAFGSGAGAAQGVKLTVPNTTTKVTNDQYKTTLTWTLNDSPL